MTWTIQEERLIREYQFKNFSEALSFVIQVGLLAEIHNHHPKIVNEYNKVRLELCTHDAGHRITAKDHELADKIDAIRIPY
ncbi:MAG TPA: 4a-hydroxytetrahydrobiopterin dehydratase [Cytophagales bacterium]|nr:4a-hydroxytetrahydrobiopterin dehydratase [Cytophagales bacterium]